MVSPPVEYEAQRLLEDIADVPRRTWLGVTTLFALPGAALYAFGYEFAAFLLGIMALNAFAGFALGVYARW